MSQAQIGPIGPFVLKSARGEIRVFDTVLEAADYIRFYGLEMVDRPLRSGFIIQGMYICEDARLHILVDECGLILPLWRINEALDQLPQRRVYWRYTNYNHEKDFRKRPLSTGSQPCRTRPYRRPRTSGEMRAHSGLEADLEELEMYPVRVKIRGRRKKLPTVWDDISRRDNLRSWKKNRLTQHKTRPMTASDEALD